MATTPNPVETKRSLVEQRPWLGNAAPVTQQAVPDQRPRNNSPNSGLRSETLPKATSQSSQVGREASPKGTPFKPTPGYKKYEPKKAQALQAKPSQASPYQASSWGPEQAPKQEAKQQSPHTPNSTFSSKPKTQPQLEPHTSIEEISPQPKQKPAEVDQNIRREIEEQVKRDLEKKYESKIQDLVRKQVRVQVRQAQQKMEFDARNAARSARVATRPLLGSTYRAPNRREPPTITGEILPLIVPGNSASPSPAASPARYLLTDSLSEAQYPTEFGAGNQNTNSNAPPQTPANTTRREPQTPQQTLQQRIDRLYDGAQSVLEKDPSEQLAASIATEPIATEPQPESVPAQVANVDPLVSMESPEPTQRFSLRTSVVGPEALLKDQSDDYEISISNIANFPATNVIVQLSVPKELTISQLDRDAYLDQKQRTVSWKIPKIEAGQKEVINYRALSGSAGKYKQEVTLGMNNSFQGRTPFTTVVQIGAKPMPTDAIDEIDAVEGRDYFHVAERLDFDD